MKNKENEANSKNSAYITQSIGLVALTLCAPMLLLIAMFLFTIMIYLLMAAFILLLSVLSFLIFALSKIWIVVLIGIVVFAIFQSKENSDKDAEETNNTSDKISEKENQDSCNEYKEPILNTLQQARKLREDNNQLRIAAARSSLKTNGIETSKDVFERYSKLANDDFASTATSANTNDSDVIDYSWEKANDE